jgi:hypothetical protein
MIVTLFREIEEAHDAYSPVDEVRGMYVHLGVEGTNSNGNEEEIDKDVSIMKIFKKLQKDVQIHHEDKKRLMRAREQQGDFNMKLMRSLEIIERKLDKESGSNKSGSHGTPEKKGRSRNGSIHH